ncbi:hypothetical protein D3C79_849570 [compost metagenome]
MRQLKIETGDHAKLQAAVVKLVIQHVAAAAAIVGNKVFVIAGYADALHVVRRTEANQGSLPFEKGKGRLLLDCLQHRAIGPLLTRHGAGFHMAEYTVDTHRTEQVRRSHLLIDALVQLRFGDRAIEVLGNAGLEKGDHGKGGFLIMAGRPSAAVGAQLMNFIIKGDQFAVKVVEGAQAKVAVPEQVGNGHFPFVDAAD